MKLVSKFIFTSTLSLVALQTRAQSSFQVTEVPLENVFVAPKGFDSNDDVLVVVEGTFPNSCYFKSSTEVIRDLENQKIVVQQLAKVETDGDCSDHSNLSVELAKPKHFFAERLIGVLPHKHQSYKVEVMGADKKVITKEFSVVKAPVDYVDSSKYAVIQKITMKDEVSSSEDSMRIEIDAEVKTSCAEILDIDNEARNSSKLYVYNDVVVVLLKVVNRGDFCVPMNKSLPKTIQVKTPPVGRYLLHVRSQGGDARNKLFSVMK